MTAHAQILKQQTVNMEIQKMTDGQRTELFIRATDELKRQKISNGAVSDKIRHYVPRMTRKRMRNIRAGIVTPSLEEIQALFDIYTEELASLDSDEIPSSEIDRNLETMRKIMSIEERMLELERQNLMLRKYIIDTSKENGES